MRWVREIPPAGSLGVLFKSRYLHRNGEKVRSFVSLYVRRSNRCRSTEHVLKKEKRGLWNETDIERVEREKGKLEAQLVCYSATA